MPELKISGIVYEEKHSLQLAAFSDVTRVISSDILITLSKLHRNATQLWHSSLLDICGGCGGVSKVIPQSHKT